MGAVVEWPGTIRAQQPFVRVQVVSPDQRLQLIDMWKFGAVEVSPENPRLVTKESREGLGGGGEAYDHTVVLKAVSEMSAGGRAVKTTVTHTLTLTNSTSRYRPGETLSFSFAKPIPGLPFQYTVEFEGGGGSRDDVEQHMLVPARASHRAPPPLAWPPCAVIEGGASGTSTLKWRSGGEGDEGAALQVRVCRQEDEEGRLPLAVLFVHPGQQTREGASLPAGLYRALVSAGARVDPSTGAHAEYYGARYLFGPAGQYFKASEVHLAPQTTLTIDFQGGNDCVPLEEMAW